MHAKREPRRRVRPAGDMRAAADARRNGVDVRARRIVWSVLAALGCATIVSAGSAWIVGREAARMRHDLQLSDANTLLGVQQLDELFTAMMSELPQDGCLAESDDRLLKTWIQFDERFLAQNAESPSLRFEKATVHRRLAFGLQLLGEHRAAVEHLREAISLLEALSGDDAATVVYVDEAADTRARLGFVFESAGDSVQAATAFLEAMQSMKDLQRVWYDPNRDVRLSAVYQSLARLANENDRKDEAINYLRQALEIRRRLVAEYPDVSEYREALTATEARIGEVNQHDAHGP